MLKTSLQELYHELHALDRFEQDHRRKLQEEDNPSTSQRGIYRLFVWYSYHCAHNHYPVKLFSSVLAFGTDNAHHPKSYANAIPHVIEGWSEVSSLLL